MRGVARGAPAKLHRHVRRAFSALLTCAKHAGAPPRRSCLSARTRHITAGEIERACPGHDVRRARPSPLALLSAWALRTRLMRVIASKRTARWQNRASIMMSAAPAKACRALLSARPHRSAVVAAAAGLHVAPANLHEHEIAMNQQIKITVSVDLVWDDNNSCESKSISFVD